MTRIMIAAPIGVVVWIALHLYYYFRYINQITDKGKSNLKKYLLFLRSWQNVGLYVTALTGQALCYWRADMQGLPFVSCIRNGLVFSWLLVIALIDGKEQLIPKELTRAGLVVWVLLVIINVWFGDSSLWNVLFFSGGGLLLGGGMFFLCRLISRGGIGMGDIRMFSVIGLLYGMNYTFSIVFFTIIFMSMFGIVAVLGKKKTLKSVLAMGPFTLAAYFVSCMLGV